MVRRPLVLLALLAMAMPAAAVRVRAPVTADIDGCVMVEFSTPSPQGATVASKLAH